MHAFLFALHPLLSLYASNITLISPHELLLPILLVGGCTAVFLLVSWLTVRAWPLAALLTSLFWILLSPYGHVTALLLRIAPHAFLRVENSLAVLWLLAIALILFIVGERCTTLARNTAPAQIGRAHV